MVDEYLIPVRYRESPIMLRKARILTYIHLFLLFITIIFEISNSTAEVEGPPLKAAILIDLTLMFIFRLKGSFNLSGNLLSLCLFLVLGEAVYFTGGLYSDNLLWIMAAPLVALLFANPISGFGWMMALLGFTVHLYLLEENAVNSYRDVTLTLDSTYYLITYLGLFVIIVGIVLIFATGQNLIIKALNEKQDELQRQKEELERQAESLRQAEQKLLASNRDLEQFAYAASHDLKEPLRMINSYTQLIQRKVVKQADDATLEYMGYVTGGVSRMEKLLSDLLEYSRLGRTQNRNKDINLNEILMVVISNLMTTMKENDAQILANRLPVLKASSTEMIQLFQNLISNSIKFRKKEQDPVIRIDYQSDHKSHVIHLHDNGIGIPKDNIEKVFNIFERLHSKEEYEGTGIGLATCKKIVTNLGGHIWIESDEGQGTSFHIKIPHIQHS